MRLIAITMIRNEADILPCFLGHCAALFDEVLAVDHGSTDGTAEMLAAAARVMPLRVWRLNQQAKLQSLVLSRLAREAVARGADWVFPLDADEFPDTRSRTELEARLSTCGPLAVWQWRNLWLGPDVGFLECRLEGRVETAAANCHKVVLARALLERHRRLVVVRGSHDVYPSPPWIGARQLLGDLLHAPVRSADRLRLKVAMNLAADALPTGSTRNQGAQYRRARARLAETPKDAEPELCRSLALGYPHFARPDLLAATEWQDLALGPRMTRLPMPSCGPAELLEREARARRDPLPDAPPDRWRLCLGDGMAQVVAL